MSGSAGCVPARWLEHAAQVGAAPAAAGARTEAIGQLAGAARFLDADKIQQLPLGDMEAEANFVVEFHRKKILQPNCRVSTASCAVSPALQACSARRGKRLAYASENAGTA